ncbi:hypothetical protein K458DRAFT_488208 [Lentithecium fluviatile CBS 122367]|uniref:Uncharacterized protein n=1 Tax=Lentithecium fluviatile CBS 122367 TaxID=1168545 RepID=A0A6G1IXK6_9PLEO|nr:hypothetical protein K458DRAFT_488208 [Lentithecium fluviatile CBS 122367]
MVPRKSPLSDSSATMERAGAREEASSDLEKPLLKTQEDLTLIPYTLYDRFLEGFVHSIFALLLPLSAIALVVVTIRIGWFLTGPDAAEILVPSAHLYNKGVREPYPIGTIFKFNEKATKFSFGATFVAIFVGFISLAWAWICLWVPREANLRKPMGTLSETLMDHQLLSGAFAGGAFIYTTYYERDAARGDGCYTHVDWKGRLVAKCSPESAACYTNYWPDILSDYDPRSLCREARIARYLTLVVALCTTALYTVHAHHERLRHRYTSQEQRREQVEKDEEQETSRWKEKSRTRKAFEIIGRVLLFTNGVLGAIKWYREN